MTIQHEYEEWRAAPDRSVATIGSMLRSEATGRRIGSLRGLKWAH